jgi:small subunit ribosomal protein S5
MNDDTKKNNDKPSEKEASQNKKTTEKKLSSKPMAKETSNDKSEKVTPTTKNAVSSPASEEKKINVKKANDSAIDTKKEKSNVDSNQKVAKNTKLSVKTNNSKVTKQNQTNDNPNTTNNDQQQKPIEQGEYIEKLVSINRVAKVVKGGRRFSFAALVVVGDGNGMVGHGKGKAKEVPEAIKKATDEAKSKMIRVPLRHGKTLHHDIKGRFDSGKVYLRSAPSGTGVIAGGPMRAVFEALGIQDIVAKSVGSSNPHNMVRATFEALKLVSSPKIIAMRRGLKINDIIKRRKFNEATENAKN